MQTEFNILVAVLAAKFLDRHDPDARGGGAEREAPDVHEDSILPLISRKPLLSLVLFAALACDGGPSSLSTGNLSVLVSGLPAASSAAIMVTGPDGYSQSVTGTQTLSQLVSGTYTVAASSVTVGSTVYSASPATQSVLVGPSTGNASIVYASGAGSLALTINGLGTSNNAAVTVTGPNSYNRSVTATQTLAGLPPGTYTITAQDVVATGGTPYTASPSSQSLTVGAGTVTANVTYTPPSSGLLNLQVAGLYLTQSVQIYGGGVPLVQNRNGYLRIFAVANRTNNEVPAVRVRIYDNFGTIVQTALIPAPGLSVPTTVDESSLSLSWNMPVSGARIQPGFRIDAEVDPAGAIPESDETDNILAPPPPSVLNVPTVNVTLVPVLQSGTGSVGNVSDPSGLLQATRSMHPLDAVNVIVRPAFTTSTTLLADGTGWAEVLNELDVKIRTQTDNSTRYYYGVAKVSYTSGVAGVAYVGTGSTANRAALGWDYLPSGSVVAAHELGHNWGRNHAPCGNPSPGGLDPSYPQPDGSIGAYGLDVATQALKPPSTSDIMGYCNLKWIGDYTYKGVMNYLRTASPLIMNSAVSPTVQPCLLVWGHVRDGDLVLEPAFQVNTRPSLPERPGPYTVSAGAADGTVLFSLSFTPNEVADLPGGQKNFAFAVPISNARARQLTTLRLSGRGRETVRRAQPPVVSGVQPRTGVKPLSAEVRRLSRGGMGIRWDARVHPMVMVRDAQTGEVLSLARGGSVQLPGFRREVDLVLSDGVKSSVRRVPVTP